MEIKVDSRRLRRSLETITGERSPFSGRRHLAAVEKFVEREFASYGLNVWSDYFSYRGVRFRNLIARRESKEERTVLILGAHLDSVPGTPGADDNASGLAVLLECARILSRIKTPAQLQFCAFNLEELNMIGSTAFAKKLKSTPVKVTAMVSLEMVGYVDPRPGSQQYPLGIGWMYPDRGDFIGVVGNWDSNNLLRRFAHAMRQAPGLAVETLSVPGNGMLIPAVRLSDHSPFWDLGYPALMVTDTSFYRNPNYHTATDTIDTLNIEFMAKVCEGVVRGVLAN